MLRKEGTMNRRTALLGALASTLPTSATAQADEPLVLARLIADVIAAGEVSGLPDMVTANVRIPDVAVTGIDAFTAASESGHAARQARYSEYEFAIQAIAEADGWQLAYVRLTGTTTAGVTVDDPGFYAARVVDGLIAELYIGQ
jgi:hypothetical protein